jgi:hypothetical protein
MQLTRKPKGADQMQENKPWGYWTLERCQAEALKYETRTAFARGSPGACKAAKSNGWLDQICGHMVAVVQKPRGYWTLERCQAEVLKYDTRKAFQLGSSGAYDAAKSNGWLDQICGHMVEVRKPKGWWTFERCHAEALKYDTRHAFARGSGDAYSAARRGGWRDRICGHMIEVQKPSGYWTFDRCQAEALKYETRKDFERGSGGAYKAAFSNGWLDQICGHMIDGSRTDGNCFYLWRAVGATYNGLPVYKCGVTSTRLGNRRVEEVAKASGFAFERLVWMQMQDAYALERKVKAMGVSPQYTDFDGCTEFRALEDDAVKQIAAQALAEFSL